MMFPSGCRAYEGNWAEGKMHGNGILFYDEAGDSDWDDSGWKNLLKKIERMLICQIMTRIYQTMQLKMKT